MNIIIVGLNHHVAPVELREMVAIPAAKKADVCAAVVDSGAAEEAVVISTCNRTEIIMEGADPERARAAAVEILSKRGGDSSAQIASLLFEERDMHAAKHLFEVITSLDSLVIGEPHIIGQVRDDLERAQGAGTVGKVLGRLFFRALELTKAVRTETNLGESPVSVSSIALDLAVRVFGEIEGRQVLVLGAGEMGRQTAILAGHRGGELTVTGRTLARAKEVAHRVGGKVVPWEDHRAALVSTDIVITSTASKEPIIDVSMMSEVMRLRKNRPVFIIDIAVPRDVVPAVDNLYNLYRYDLDDLREVANENAARRRDEIPKVQQMIRKALKQYERWCREIKVVPEIVALRETVEHIRETELEAHLRKMHSLNERDRNLVEALTLAITNKVLHNPTVRLKDAAADGIANRHVSSLRYLFDLGGEKADDSDE